MPRMRLYARGERNETLFAILRANVRCRTSCSATSRRRWPPVTSASARCRNCRAARRPRLGGAHGRAARLHRELLRREIASWPDGTATSPTTWTRRHRVRDVELTVDLTIRGDEVIADFSRSAPMVRGALNSTPSFAEASAYQTVMAASAIDIPRTGGAIRPITVITKPGTVMHVLMPGASSMRGITGYRLSDVMNGALAQLVPDRVPAAGEGGSTLAFFTGTGAAAGSGSTASWSSAPGAAGRCRTATTGSRTRARRWRTSPSRSPRRSGRSWSSATGWSPTPAAPAVPRGARGGAGVALGRARHHRARALGPPDPPAVWARRRRRGRARRRR